MPLVCPPTVHTKRYLENNDDCLIFIIRSVQTGLKGILHLLKVISQSRDTFRFLVDQIGEFFGIGLQIVQLPFPCCISQQLILILDIRFNIDALIQPAVSTKERGRARGVFYLQG